VSVDDLAWIDEHACVIRAGVDEVFAVAVRTLLDGFTGGPARVVAKVLGCDPTEVGTDLTPRVGLTVAGFAVTQLEPPHLVVLRGRHRFSRYAIVLTLEPDPAGSRCVIESRGEFPGLTGQVYETLVIGSRGHVVAVRHLLRRIRTAAEQPQATPAP
jgi:hypothetical protein